MERSTACSTPLGGGSNLQTSLLLWRNGNNTQHQHRSWWSKTKAFFREAPREIHGAQPSSLPSDLLLNDEQYLLLTNYERRKKDLRDEEIRLENKPDEALNSFGGNLQVLSGFHMTGSSLVFSAASISGKLPCDMGLLLSVVMLVPYVVGLFSSFYLASRRFKKVRRTARSLTIRFQRFHERAIAFFNEVNRPLDVESGRSQHSKASRLLEKSAVGETSLRRSEGSMIDLPVSTRFTDLLVIPDLEMLIREHKISLWATFVASFLQAIVFATLVVYLFCVILA